MDSKLFKFIVLMTFASVFVWLGGEALILFVLKLGPVPNIIWSVFMLGSLVVINIARALKDDDDDDQNTRNW